MTLLLALVVSVLFGTGAYLLVKRDLFRVVVGIIMISNAANLFLMSSALSRGRAPIHPLPETATVSDPLVQALTLTAIVITFGVTAVLLSLAYRLFTAHQSMDLLDIADAEAREEIDLEQDGVPR